MTSAEYHSPRRPWSGRAFVKLEGLGNDFLVLDERELSQPSLTSADRQALCDRHRGVGADGVLTVLAPRTEGAACTMHVTNADGSEPEMCGNGLRCVCRWLVEEGLVPVGEVHVVDTGAGPRRCRVLPEASDDEGEGLVEVEMGPASLDGVVDQGRLRSEEIVIDERQGRKGTATAVSMGNPHLVLLEGLPESAGGGGPDEASFAWCRALGPGLEHHPRFPHRTNVGFARQRGEGLDLIVWERGCGLTQACGTGACAAAAAYVDAGRLEAGRPLRVALPGGALHITVAADLRGVTMAGPARRVYAGRLA